MEKLRRRIRTEKIRKVKLSCEIRKMDQGQIIILQKEVARTRSELVNQAAEIKALKGENVTLLKIIREFDKEQMNRLRTELEVLNKENTRLEKRITQLQQ